MKPSNERVQIPQIAWNNLATGIQVARALSGSYILRVDSLPDCVDKHALRTLLPNFDLTWVNFTGFVELLNILYLRKLLSSEDCETVKNQVTDTVSRMKEICPSRSKLKTEEEIFEMARKHRYADYEVKEDLVKIIQAGREFYDVMRAPVQRLFDPVVVFRRVKEEQNTLRGTEGKRVLLSRAKKNRAALLDAEAEVESRKEKVQEAAKRAIFAEKRLATLRAEQADLSVKLGAFGIDLSEIPDEIDDEAKRYSAEP